jgi:hypothetical protein
MDVLSPLQEELINVNETSGSDMNRSEPNLNEYMSENVNETNGNETNGNETKNLANYFIVNKQLCLVLTLPFLFFQSLMLLWIQLAFIIDCGIFVNFWFGGTYIILTIYTIIYIIKFHYNILKEIIVLLIFIISFIWMFIGIKLNQSYMYNECKDTYKNILLSTIICLYLPPITIYTFILLKM